MTLISSTRRVAACATALAVLGFVLYLAGSGLVRGITISALSLVVGGIVVVRMVGTTGSARLVYGLLLAGFMLLTGANILWLVTVPIGGAHVAPRPESQLLIGTAYLLLLGAAFLAIVPSVRRDVGSVLDAATAGVAGAAALWLALLAPAFEGGGAAGDRIYVFAITTLLSASAGIVIGVSLNGSVPRSALPALAGFVLAIVLALTSNTLTLVASDPVTGAPPWWAGAGWALGYAAAWAAIAHPAGPEAFTVGPPRSRRLTRLRILALGLALTSTPLIAVTRSVTGHSVDWLPGAFAHLVVITLVLVRVSQLATAHHAAEARLRYLADHDGLTGLPNRRAVERHLAALTERVAAGTAPGAVVLFVDLNGFKQINDSRGHVTGDELLTAVGRRLAALSRTGGRDLVGRLGGDEFVAVLETEATTAIAESAAARIVSAFGKPFALSDGPARVGASVGFAVARPGEPLALDTLLRRADRAMYQDKRAQA
ncbi:GGDEF domain-containing protein [Demequina gelatinilytica]|uniref:GGDEF domain-containing protein n=1 Tax=Demequina gelatinilytica TaxID=1638980 RepID=UPI0007831995|nr:GGDEF domain-containing protein [Demequina gelatinilytica]